MTSPIQMASAGPKITPYSATQQGGGAALPPYLQMRRPTNAVPGMAGANPVPSYAGQQTQPVLTPKSTVAPQESKPQAPSPMASTATPGAPALTPPAPAPQPPTPSVPNLNATGATASPSSTAAPGSTPPPQAGGQNLNDVYNFFKSDLLNQTNQALANARTDASARGVFYGTPLTGSEADINTQYLRGLGQLQSGMYGNEQQNELARLGLASSLGWQSSMNAPPAGNNQDYFSTLGGLFGPQNQPMGQQPSISAPRPGPTGNPNQGVQTGIDPLTGQPYRL